MSYRREKNMSLAGIDYSNIADEDLLALFNKYLDNGIHGICFSSYLDGQGPGTQISDEQIEKRIKIIKPYTKWLRTFSCTDGGERIPVIAKKHGLKVMAGAWLSDNKEVNEKEIENVIKLAKEGNADLVAVGNEVLYRKELTEEELLDYISRIKKEIPGIPVGYVDAYYEFVERPAITDACDVIFANCYPFWEGCHIDYSLPYMKNMYQNALNAGGGKKVIITETGWPNRGTSFEGSEPSLDNALRYFINAQKWSMEEDIDLFYFSSFDETWKIDAEGDVGAYWGLWDQAGKLKFGK